MKEKGSSYGELGRSIAAAYRLRANYHSMQAQFELEHYNRPLIDIVAQLRRELRNAWLEEQKLG